MDKTVRMADAAERAITIVTAVIEGAWTKPGSPSTRRSLEAFTDEVRDGVLATVVGLVGAFEGFGEGEPFVRRIGDVTVVDIPLCCEDSDMKARVGLDADESVASIFIRNYYLTACADLRTSPGKHRGVSPANTAAVSPSRWQGNGKLALPEQAR